jgi:hypothetical protein
LARTRELEFRFDRRMDIGRQGLRSWRGNNEPFPAGLGTNEERSSAPMNQRLRLTSSVVASSFALLALAGFHGACAGVVLLPDVLDATADGPTRTMLDSSLDSSPGDGNASPDSSQPAGDGNSENDAGGCATVEGKVARWSVMDEAPFAPWNMAGLDLGSVDAGITLSEAESINCLGNPVALASFPDAGTPDGGVCDPCGHCYAEIAWGSVQEVEFEYDMTTHVVAQVVLNMGYWGAADFWSDPDSKLDPPGAGASRPSPTAPKANHYHMVIGEQIQKNGEPFELDWEDPTIASHMMIYNAMMYSYGSPRGLYSGHDDPESCESDQTCVFGPPKYAASFGGLCLFGIRPLHLYLETVCATVLQPAVSTLAQVYQEGDAFDYALGFESVDGGVPVTDDAGGYVYTCDAAVP